MKKSIVTSAALLIMSGFAYAGGDLLLPVFETEEVFVPVEPYVAPVVPVIIPPVAPIVVATPVVKVVAPVINDILPLGLYVGLGVSAARFDPNCGCKRAKGDSDKTAGIIGRIGYDFNEYIGVEARAIRTNWKSHGGKIKHAGLFVKPMYPVSDDINVYGLAGYAKTTTQGSKRRVDAEALAWGLGLEYDLGSDAAKQGKYSRAFDGYGDQEHGWGLFADYERLVQKSGSPNLDTVNVGVTYDF
jgi:OOP family OmpA-OmpF porin